jgi:hypothetical protein
MVSGVARLLFDVGSSMFDVTTFGIICVHPAFVSLRRG